MKTILIIFFSSSLLANGQIVVLKDYVLTNAKEIKSISPADKNYNDFADIEKAINNSRVVMVGEQDHGDNATFHMNPRPQDLLIDINQHVSMRRIHLLRSG